MSESQNALAPQDPPARSAEKHYSGSKHHRIAKGLAFFGLLLDGVAWTVLNWPTVGAWLALNRDAAEVISGGMVAVFTGALWYSTDKLWTAGGETLAEMREQRRVMDDQQKALTTMADAYRRMLVASHPPVLAIIGAELQVAKDGQTALVDFWVHNQGGTAATVRYSVIYDSVPSEKRPGDLRQIRGIKGQTIKAGDSVNYKHTCDEILPADIPAQTVPTLELRGLVSYEDEMKNARALDFLMRYNRLSKRFEMVAEAERD